MSNVFSDKNLNGNSLLQVGKVEITVDAADSNDAVRKSQAEAIASNATQSAIVNSLASPNATTTLDTEQLQSQLNAKQNNMSIDPSSTSFLEIVDGTKIKLKDLGIISTYRDTTNTSLTAFIAACTFNGDGTITVGGETLDKMTFIFLTNATLPEDRSFVYLGTNNGDATDFVVFGADYNESEIRSFFSGSGTGITFDANTGVFTLNIGTTASDLGGQTIPHGATFTTISTDGKINDALVKLETLINAVEQSGADGTASVTTRLNNLSGVTGSNYGSFPGGVLGDNKDGKQLFTEIETALKSATSDRAAIRSEATARANTVDTAIASEASARESADNTLQSNLDSEAATRATADAGLQANITNEAITRSSADVTLQSNIDAEASAREAADTQEATDRANAIAAEATARTNADDALQDQINVLAGSNIELVGTVGTDGVFDAVEADARNGEVFTSIAMTSGEVVIIDGDVTMLGEDFKVGDMLTVKVAAIVAGNMQLSDFIYQKGSNTDLTRANLDDVTITLDGSEKLIVTHNSIERQELGPVVKAELDDTMSLTSANSRSSFGDTWAYTDSTTGAVNGTQLQYAYLDSETSSATLGTQRMYLDIHKVNTSGSGNPILPSQAVVRTQELEYHGSCTDFSVNVVTDNAELNHHTAAAKTNSSARTSIVTGAHAGLSSGHTASASGSTLQNMGNTSHAQATGLVSDVGQYSVLSDVDLRSWAALAAVDPLTIDGLPFDSAHTADARTATSGYAHVSLGRPSYFDPAQPVYMPSAYSGNATERSPVILSDVKGKQDIIEFDLSSGSATVTTNLDLDKVPPVGDGQIKHGVTGVTVSVSENVATSELTFTATGSNVSSLTSVKVYLQELSCDVRNV